MVLKRLAGESLDEYETRLRGLFGSHPRCKIKHHKRLVAHTTQEGRLQYLRGTMCRWAKEYKQKRAFGKRFVQGGLVNPR
jgi:hypothetical protein